MTPLLCGCAVVITLETQKCQKREPRSAELKGAVSRYSVIFCAFFCARKNGDCSRKCRGHQTMTARSAARTASPAKLSRENVVFLEQVSFSASLPCGRHYFSPHKMAAKNHRLSWHCRFNFFVYCDRQKRFLQNERAEGLIYKTLPQIFQFLPRDFNNDLSKFRDDFSPFFFSTLKDDN